MDSLLLISGLIYLCRQPEQALVFILCRSSNQGQGRMYDDTN